MLAKLFQKNTAQQPPPLHPPPAPPAAKVVEENAGSGKLRAEDVNPRVTVHYGIPSTASILAFDPIQSLLAVATLDGRIKVIGGDNIEGLLVSPKQLPFKNLEFLQNQGFLVSITTENEIQVWDLEQRRLASTLQWESNITAFSVICSSSYMYVGDEYGMVSVLKYDAKGVKLIQLPYYVPTDAVAEASGISFPNHRSVVGLLPQPASQGNRLLTAYDNGLIILWDVSEDKVILTKGNNDLQLKSKTLADFQEGIGHELSDDISEYEPMEKEISSLCWASADGSVLAVGYVDGDVMLWNLTTTASADKKAEKSSNDVVKLQLSSADRRLPVIVLHWYPAISHNGCRGQLFVYGGDAIGSEEVLTILSIDWFFGIETLKCIGRLDLTLNGSFADMVLLPSDGMSKARGTLILTNPGQLHFYDHDCFASLESQQQKQNSLSSMQYPMVIPIVEPYMTVGKLGLVYKDGESSKALSKTISTAKLQVAHKTRNMNWPLTGGVPSQSLDSENYQVERLYIAGYQDGSVRIWDATHPTFTLIYVLGLETIGINIAGGSASVSALEFCSFSLSLATGNELGMVCVYKLMPSPSETCLHFVKETEKEVHTLHQGDGPHCAAIFSLLSSPICTLQFANFGTKLTVGFRCGKVAMVDMSTLSMLFLTDIISNPSSPIKCLAVKPFLGTISSINNPEDIESKSKADHMTSEVFIVTNDGHIVAIDDMTGGIIWSHSLVEKESTVISMHIIEGGSEKHSFNSTQDNKTRSEPDQVAAHCRSTQLKVDSETCAETAYSGHRTQNFLLLVCCENALHLYCINSLNKGDRNPIQKLNLLRPCCWTTTFKKDDKECGLIVLYQSGVIEIRSLSDLEVVGETSLMSILRWNFKTSMEKTICSCDAAQIMLVNACEFASVSLLACENNFRIPESLPCLHNKVLAAAAAAAAASATTSLSPDQKKVQGAASGILGGFIKGLQVSKVEELSLYPPEVCGNKFEHLESIFSSPPYLKPSLGSSHDQKLLELSIDDIDIDNIEEHVVSSSLETDKKERKDKGTEREILFEGATTDSNPRLRTAEEIKAKYRKEDPSAAAARARDKLAERGEKLERLSLRTEELQSGAENFASMASELAKQMEKRKWWNI